MHVSSSKNIQLLEKKIGYSFKRKALLKEALTHKSFAKEQTEDTDCFNERLEFLGDSVLELVITGYLFKTYPQYSEAELSKIKAYAVREATLAEVALKIGIGSYLLCGKGEESSGGKKKPSLLANAFEALLAAIYLDSGLRKASEIILGYLKPKINYLIKKDLLFDFKTSFQELVQRRFGVLPRYSVSREEGPEHMKTFEVSAFVRNDFYGSGSGKSKKEAEQKAAYNGLKKLKTKSRKPR